MPRNGFARMDLDTRWPFDRKVRRLQRLYPAEWTHYWAAYLVLVAEAWASRTREVTMSDAWIVALPCQEEEAVRALIGVHLLDDDGQIPVQTWGQWYEPAEARLVQRESAGRMGAAKRWHGGAMAPLDQPHATALPSQPANQTSQVAGASAQTYQPSSALHDGHHGPDCFVCAPLLEKGRPA